MPGRIDHVVLKVAGLCNLDCSYCYVYKHEDHGYRERPRFISDATYRAALAAMRRHCDTTGQDRMGVIFHGGEPTLVGAERFEWMLREAKAVVGPRLGRLSIQTNGTLLDGAWTRVLAGHGVSVGISLDGPADIHDAQRVDHGGRGSHASAVAGLLRAQRAGLSASVLCVIQPGRSGLEAYRHFRSLDVSRMDFLLPDVSHDTHRAWYGRFGPTPVADYLLPILDAWMDEDDPGVRIRIFDNLFAALLGGTGATDGFGNPQMGYLVVETDGSIEALDALRVCAEGIQKSGLNVRTHGFGDLEQGLPLVHQLVHSRMPLSPTCQACSEVACCGGGYLPHRYSRKRQFDNPSVWCADILKLIARMREYVGRTPVA